MSSSLWNPLSLPLSTLLLVFVGMRGFLALMDGVCLLFLSKRVDPLPSRRRESSVSRGRRVVKHPISLRDCAYLALNSVVELVFSQHVLSFLSSSLSSSPFASSLLSLLLSPFSVWLLFLLDDMLYAPLHMWMHHKSIYPLFHKHHHRNTYPSRGYIDAGNEHPVEQILALSLHFLSLRLSSLLLMGHLHPASVLSHLFLKAVGAVLNHTGLDVRLRFLGIDYSVRAHEMHHRRPTCNFGQYVMVWDRWMGTYSPYEG